MIVIGVWAVLAGVFGLAIGSFLNVVVYRVPAGLSVVSPPSACPNCTREIRNRHNVPVLGWLVLRGRCFDCGAPISWRYPVVEALTGLAFAAVTARIVQQHWSGAVAAFLAVTATVIAVSLITFDGHRVPGSVGAVGGILAAGAFVGAAAYAHDWAALLRGTVAAAAVASAGFALTVAWPRWSRVDAVPYLALLAGALAFRSWAALLIGLAAAVGAGLGLTAVRWPARWVAVLGPLCVGVLLLPGSG